MSGVCGKLGAGFSGNEDTKAELLLIESLSWAQSKFCAPCCLFFCPSQCLPILEGNLLVTISLPTQATFSWASHSFPNSFASLPPPTLGPTLWLVNANPLQIDFSLLSHFILPFPALQLSFCFQLQAGSLLFQSVLQSVGSSKHRSVSGFPQREQQACLLGRTPPSLLCISAEISKACTHKNV